MIYNYPGRTGVDMPPEFIERLAELKHVRYVKESTGEMPRITELSGRCGDRLGVFCGCDTIAPESLMVGAIGWAASRIRCREPQSTLLTTIRPFLVRQRRATSCAGAGMSRRRLCCGHRSHPPVRFPLATADRRCHQIDGTRRLWPSCCSSHRCNRWNALCQAATRVGGDGAPGQPGSPTRRPGRGRWSWPRGRSRTRASRYWTTWATTGAIAPRRSKPSSGRRLAGLGQSVCHVRCPAAPVLVILPLFPRSGSLLSDTSLTSPFRRGKLR